ncbi:MAG: ABC transporter ATP-binding protein [Dehalococcoidales bacterium]|nr:ABC transporter ATP-binding protein [Dehalococcoidales bacterium]
MNGQAVITTRGLTRRFGEKVAVDELTLAVHAGEVFGLLGHNGAGKTTTVRLINGVLTPSGGEVRALGLDPATQGAELRRRTGVLTETPSLDERLTARDNLTIYADLYGVPQPEVKPRVAEMLATFDLADRADEKVGGYSKGMKQRLALCRALLHEPDILFLDEPTSGLDPVASRQVHTMITRLSRTEGRTVLLCTHNLAEAQQLCDRVAVMQHGRLVALGTPAELARQLGQAATLEIEVAPEDLTTASRVLRSLDGLAVEAGEDGLIAIQGAARTEIPGILASLVGAGVKTYRLSPREMSLEDIYFALVEKKEVAV